MTNNQTTGTERRMREILAKHHKDTLGFYVGPESLPKWVLDAMLLAQAEGRREGQDEGFAAAVQWLRDRSAIKPPPVLWHAADILANQLEQSRIPASNDPAFIEGGK